jgi:hypothetical protein
MILTLVVAAGLAGIACLVAGYRMEARQHDRDT